MYIATPLTEKLIELVMYLLVAGRTRWSGLPYLPDDSEGEEQRAVAAEDTLSLPQLTQLLLEGVVGEGGATGSGKVVAEVREDMQ